MTFALVAGAALIDGALVTGARIVIRDGRIEAAGADVRIGDLPLIDAKECVVTPGLIDIHTHGAYGQCFNGCSQADATAVLRALGARGVTAVVPTLVSAPIEELWESVETLATLPSTEGAAAVVGLHLEGPCLAPSQRGAHDLEHLRSPDDPEVGEFLANSADESRMIVTLAPELPGALQLVRRLAERSAIVAAGHSEATAQELRAAEDEGLSHVVHLWSSQSTVVRRGPWRMPGLLEGALASETLTAEVIADGSHLPTELVAIALRCVPPGRLCAVSDSTAGAGLPEGTRYSLGSVRCVVGAGVGLLEGDEASFGGSTTFLDEMPKRLAPVAGVARALSMVTEVPARVLGLPTKGVLRPGADADLVLFDDTLAVRRVFVGGRSIRD